MAKVIVENHRPTLLALPALEGFDRVPLKPGTNEVDSKYLETVKKRPSVIAWVNAGYISGDTLKADVSNKTVSGSSASQQAEESELAQFDVPDARDMVADETDLDTLRRWRGQDTRKGVTSAIDQRINVLEGRG